MSDNFLSNLKQFLTERPIKIRGDFRSPLMPASFGGDFGDNLKDFFSSRPVAKGRGINRLEVQWGAGFGSFGDRIKEVFFPKKLPPLKVTSKPIRVKDIWSKDENFGWTQAISIGIHAAVILLAVVPIVWHLAPPTEAKNKNVDVTPIDLSPYVTKLPAGAQKAGGGGGSNDRSLTPPTKGKPKFTWTQFTPPQAKIQNLNPKLAMDPSLLGPPDLKMNVNLPNIGDPLANSTTDSLGRGNGTGVGSGNGGGLGPGEGGGTGGGVFRAGVNGVGTPACIYCPDPPYSDEARKAKYQGIVIVDLVVSADGRVLNARVIKGPGLGLEENTIQTVMHWRFKPAVGPNGRAVPVSIPVEVTFRLF